MQNLAITSFYTIIKGIILSLVLLTTLSAVSQPLNLGNLPITSFTKDDYSAGHQNWDVQRSESRIYFANNGGLLSYDGSNWQTHVTPNNTILRSIATGGPDTVYVGGQGELGYFAPNERGYLKYHSLVDPENNELGEIWDLVYANGKTYALTQYNEVTEFKGTQAKRYGHKEFITKLCLVDNEVWFHEHNKGLFHIRDDHAHMLPSSQETKDWKVADILKRDSSYIILTENLGIFLYNKDEGIKPWKTNNDAFLKTKKILCGILDFNGNLIIGTSFGGAVTISQDGKFTRLLNKTRGLRNNHVSAIVQDKAGNLWIGTQNGINKVQYQNAKSTFYPDRDLEGSIYDVQEWSGKFFFATSNGLYYIDKKQYYDPLEGNKFEFVSGTEGETWGLDLINGELFLAHGTGAYRVNSSFALEPIGGAKIGSWKFVPLKENILALGTYSGVFILKKKNGKWAVVSRVPGLDVSCRIMLYDDYSNLWISHPYKKVYKVNFTADFTNSNLKEYDADDGLITNKRNYIFGIGGEAIVTNEAGAFQYHMEADSFRISTMMSQFYPSGIHLKRIIHQNNQYWTISDNGTDRVELNNLGPETRIQIERIATKEGNQDYIGGFENLYPLDNNSFLQCTYSGVKIISAQPIMETLNAPLITSVGLQGARDSIIFGGFGASLEHSLPDETTSIRFNLSSSTKDNFGHYFMVYLEGMDKKWSEWTTMTTKEYTNLPYGNYTFHAKAVNIYNRESAPASFQFTIPTPWQHSRWFRLLLAAILTLALLSLLLIPRKIYKENTALLESEKRKTEEAMIKVKEEKEAEVISLAKAKDAEMQQVKEEAERELERINREKLENEILFKNKELAMSTMNLLQKNETLSAIRSEVELVEKMVKDPEAKKEVKKIISLLRTDDRLEDDWNNFSIHFDQAHHQFLKRIKTEFPQLTPKDQKLCAYLRMNLSTKEIAPLLKISVRGVEISRYRLRKKIGLKKEINLNDYMMNY